MEYVEDGYPEPGPKYLEPTAYFDFDQAIVRDFADEAVAGATTDVDKAVKLFYAVRDLVRYDPYQLSRDPATYTASHVVSTKASFCIPKANLLIALARATGIYAGLGLSDVTNHLCTDRLLRGDRR